MASEKVLLDGSKCISRQSQEFGKQYNRMACPGKSQARCIDLSYANLRSLIPPMVMYFILRYSSIPYLDPSRPTPDLKGRGRADGHD